jgi:hypothetical protein
MLWFSSSKFGSSLLSETLFHLFDVISLEALCINVRVQMETEFQDLNTFPNSVWERETIWEELKNADTASQHLTNRH